jgi:hypothetical protein
LIIARIYPGGVSLTKLRGLVLILLGLLAAAFVCTYDIIVGKPVNDITGPKSISALIFCGLMIIAGIYLLIRASRQ